MRRLVIDEIVKQGEKSNYNGDPSGLCRSIELLRNITCSIGSTICAGQPSNPNKLTEMQYILECIKRLQSLK